MSECLSHSLLFLFYWLLFSSTSLPLTSPFVVCIPAIRAGAFLCMLFCQCDAPSFSEGAGLTFECVINSCSGTSHSAKLMISKPENF